MKTNYTLFWGYQARIWADYPLMDDPREEMPCNEWCGECYGRLPYDGGIRWDWDNEPSDNVTAPKLSADYVDYKTPLRCDMDSVEHMIDESDGDRALRRWREALKSIGEDDD